MSASTIKRVTVVLIILTIVLSAIVGTLLPRASASSLPTVTQGGYCRYSGGLKIWAYPEEVPSYVTSGANQSGIVNTDVTPQNYVLTLSALNFNYYENGALVVTRVRPSTQTTCDPNDSNWKCLLTGNTGCNPGVAPTETPTSAPPTDTPTATPTWTPTEPTPPTPTITPDPLGVVLEDFFAVQTGASILVTWETNTELNNRGFNLYRGTSEAGPNLQLNDYLIPSQSQGNPGGFVYTWTDQEQLVYGTTYFYWVEDVDVNGTTTRHGPASTQFLAPNAVTFADLSVEKQNWLKHLLNWLLNLWS